MKLRTHVAFLLLVTAGATGLMSGTAHAGGYTANFNNGAGCGMFTASATPGYSAMVCGGQYLAITGGGLAGDVAVGSEDNISTTAPAGVTIDRAVTNFQRFEIGSEGWGAGDFYSGGGESWDPTANSSPITDPPFASSEWGFQLECNGTGCHAGQAGDVSVNSITFQATEAQSPTLTPSSGSLYDQNGYVWNPAGDPWSIGVSGSDPSGTCGIDAIVNGLSETIEAQSNNEYTWQQCANGSWPGTVDTHQFVGTSGPLSLTYQGTNAAANTTTLQHTVQVDNDPVDVSLATPNDANPTVWVNHAVDVTAAVSAGPSGIASTDCSTDGGTAVGYSAGGLSVDGDGVHTVSCIAANNAVDPQGAHDTGTGTQTIKIDEAPPQVSFAPVDPSNPTQVEVSAPDGESGLGSGSITIQGPHATTATPLATAVGGSTLTANIDDQSRRGDYVITANACDNVGNCASTSETLHFPLRLGDDSVLSFSRIRTPATTVRRRVRVGYHYKIVHRRIRVGYHYKTVIRRRHGHRVRVRVKVGGHEKRVRRRIRVGGHFIHVRVRIHASRRCGHRRVRVARRRWRELTSCRVLKARIVTRRRIGYGRRARLHGLLVTGQGVPVAHAPVHILTRPDDRGGKLRLVRVVTTNGVGRWSATLPGGPSRTVKAYYPGSDVLEPVTGTARLTVPARIRLSISPHVLPWAHAIHIQGHLAGRYVPRDGVALRLLVHYPQSRQWTVLLALRTTRHGGFDFEWNYHAGRGVATYPFRVATTATETDYPYASGASPPMRITFGRATPRRRAHHHPTRHHRTRRHPRHRNRHRRR